jgi:hypothetical protein
VSHLFVYLLLRLFASFLLVYLLHQHFFRNCHILRHLRKNNVLLQQHLVSRQLLDVFEVVPRDCKSLLKSINFLVLCFYYSFQAFSVVLVCFNLVHHKLFELGKRCSLLFYKLNVLLRNSLDAFVVFAFLVLFLLNRDLQLYF